MRKNLLIILFVIALSSIPAKAKETIDLERRISIEEVTPGIIIKEGKVIEGYIWNLHASYLGVEQQYVPSPWRFQDEIRFIPKEEFETLKKVKNKHYTKYKAKDLDGYRYDTLV